MHKNLGTSAGLLALFAMVFRMSGPGTHERANTGEFTGHGTKQEQTTAEANKKGSEDSQQPSTETEEITGPWTASRAFLYAGKRSRPAAKDGKPLNLSDSGAVTECASDAGCKQQLRQFFGLDDGHSYNVLLATVADPVRTRLSLATDDAINAIEEAAGDDGWEFAEQWLPWPGGPRGAQAEPEQRNESTAELRLKETQPGLLVFRHGSSGETPDPRILFILLVGETPTAGINGLQFRTARAYMEALASNEAPSDPVRMLSPMFSGSFYSLAELLREDQAAYHRSKYMLRSGTATSETGARLVAAIADFHSANEGIADQQAHFLELLKELNIPRERAAYLIEGESGYGNEFVKRPKSEMSKKATADNEPIRTLRFPREISHLRNAYREAVVETSGQNAPAPDLNFTLKDTGGGEDGVPLFSETQTPLAQNAVMQQIANEIRRNRIRMVEAGATNVLDLLFVARVIREQCPDTRLIVAFPDLLFVQALQTEPLGGMLALSTYPLFFQRQKWMGDPPTGVTFPDMNAEGVYNAAILLLNPEKKEIPQLADYNWNQLHHPPAWLMLLDHGGFSPIEVLNPGEKQWFDDRTSSPISLRLPWPSRPWMLLTIITLMCSLALCGVIFKHLHNPAFRFLESVTPDCGSQADAARQFFLFATLMILTFLQLVLWLPWLFHKHELVATVLQFLLAVGAAVSLGTATWVAWKRLWCSKAKGIRACIIATSLAFIAATALWAYCTKPGEKKSFFFSFRSVEMQFGSSPMVPILAASAALLVLALVHLKRFQLIAKQRPILSANAFDSALKGALHKSACEMERALSLPCGLSRRQALTKIGLWAAALALMCVVLQIPVNFASIDGTAYDVLCISLQVAVIVALLATCWQIRSAWSWFHLFLTSLRTLPLSNSFLRITESGHSGPIWTRRLNLLSLEIPVESAKTLHDMHLLASDGKAGQEVTSGEVEQWHCTYRNAVQELLEAETATSPLSRTELFARFCRLRTTGASLSNRIAERVLMPHWKESKLAMPNEAGSKGEEAKDASEPAFEDLAERFVGFHLSCFALYGVRHIQNLLWFVSLGFVLLVFSLNSYAFQSPQQIGRFLILLFVAIGFVSWRCMAGMERNPILSRIAGTGEGELNKGFYLKLASYGALPVVGLLATQFPSISKFLFSWVEPALAALK